MKISNPTVWYGSKTTIDHKLLLVSNVKGIEASQHWTEDF